MLSAAGIRSNTERDARRNFQCRYWREGVSWEIRRTSQVSGSSLARSRNFCGSKVIKNDLCRRRATGEQVRPYVADIVTRLHAFGKNLFPVARLWQEFVPSCPPLSRSSYQERLRVVMSTSRNTSHVWQLWESRAPVMNSTPFDAHVRGEGKSGMPDKARASQTIPGYSQQPGDGALPSQ
jgi:hypothetical protein